MLPRWAAIMLEIVLEVIQIVLNNWREGGKAGPNRWSGAFCQSIYLACRQGYQGKEP